MIRLKDTLTCLNTIFSICMQPCTEYKKMHSIYKNITFFLSSNNAFNIWCVILGYFHLSWQISQRLTLCSSCVMQPVWFWEAVVMMRAEQSGPFLRGANDFWSVAAAHLRARRKDLKNQLPEIITEQQVSKRGASSFSWLPSYSSHKHSDSHRNSTQRHLCFFWILFVFCLCPSRLCVPVRPSL